MVAVFVKIKMLFAGEWRDAHSWAGNFENIAESLGYLKFLENKQCEFYVQLGFVGWETGYGAAE